VHELDDIRVKYLMLETIIRKSICCLLETCESLLSAWLCDLCDCEGGLKYTAFLFSAANSLVL